MAGGEGASGMCLVCSEQGILELLGLEASRVALVTVSGEAALRMAGLEGLLVAGLGTLTSAARLTSTGLLGLAAPLQTVSRRRTRCRTSTP
ncbi:hypothetical protein [Haloarcula sp. CBA1131]|uniref:hypothetical protein n=1 Tax=Haloarcula sp. CBA1131 TaxID=1853686 RepID=UPI001248FE88|nr:hypothetical protein [Haloarcula sp. CBA1131]